MTQPIQGIPAKPPIENIKPRCAECGVPISKTVLKFSMSLHRKPTCYNCQDKLTKKK